MKKEKRVVIFCRSKAKFVPPKQSMFPWKSETDLLIIDVGESYQDCLEGVEKTIDAIFNLHKSNKAEMIYIAIAGDTGFVWLLARKLARELPSAKVEFLQMTRDKKMAADENKYQIWPELKSYQVWPER